MKQEGYKQNTARVKSNAIIQFLKFYDTPVKYRKSLGIYRSEIATGEHHLTVSELQEMGSVAFSFLLFPIPILAHNEVADFVKELVH